MKQKNVNKTTPENANISKLSNLAHTWKFENFVFYFIDFVLTHYLQLKYQWQKCAGMGLNGFIFKK